MGDTHYRITFKDPQTGETTQIRAREVGDSTLGLGFVCISDFLLEPTGMLVDPAAEALAKRFADVKRLHLHLYGVLAIEEIGAEHGGLELDPNRAKLIVLPGPGEST